VAQRWPSDHSTEIVKALMEHDGNIWQKDRWSKTTQQHQRHTRRPHVGKRVDTNLRLSSGTGLASSLQPGQESPSCWPGSPHIHTAPDPRLTTGTE